MLSAFVRAFRTPDLRKKLLFTLFIIAIYRLGTAVPTPGVAYTKVRDCLSGADPQAGTGMLGVMRRLAAFDGTMRVSSPARKIPRITPTVEMVICR